MHLAHILPLLLGLLAIFAPEPTNAEPSFESIARKGTTERVTTADVAEFAEAKHREIAGREAVGVRGRSPPQPQLRRGRARGHARFRGPT